VLQKGSEELKKEREEPQKRVLKSYRKGLKS
jgi:hypothetical protein